MKVRRLPIDRMPIWIHHGVRATVTEQVDHDVKDPTRRFETTVLGLGDTRSFTGVSIDVPKRVTLSCPCATVSRDFPTSWATVEGIRAYLIRQHRRRARKCPHPLEAAPTT